MKHDDPSPRASESEPRGAEREPSHRYENLPLVVIAGRPNVGKSTLFNRLLHQRRTITDPTPGVTRDPVDAVWELRAAGGRARLVDTGGFKLEREGLDGLVVEKSLEALARADLILFVVDAVEVNAEDEEFALLLRKWSSKLLLVVNKADSPERDALVWTHAKWGFDPVLFVSAEHGRNIGELEEAVAARLDFERVVDVEEERPPIRLAIMGKPNTGKSTLLNRLLGEEKSIVSEVAGTTRDVVEGRFVFKGRQIVVLDTAGIRRKKKVTEAIEYYSVNRAIRTVGECDVVVLMIDAREGLTDQDKKISAFASEKGRGLVFALSKWDTMPDLKNSFEAARDKLRYFFGQMAWAPVLPLSALEGTGVDKLMNTVVNLHAQLTKRVETGRLNRAMEEWIEATPPPVGRSTRFKLRYAVQTGVNPQAFAVFVTRPEAVAEAYVSFLRNKIREELGLDKIPVLLELKESHTRVSARERINQTRENPKPAPRHLAAWEAAERKSEAPKSAERVPAPRASATREPAKGPASSSGAAKGRKGGGESQPASRISRNRKAASEAAAKGRRGSTAHESHERGGTARASPARRSRPDAVRGLKERAAASGTRRPRKPRPPRKARGAQ
ncbi:MAG TPA: ribosome biogenesis GTPase Der [Rectinemataceae bacterium]|nr:ribosome biogenesis GTPase Der [Rectinemataceae bacterium]